MDNNSKILLLKRGTHTYTNCMKICRQALADSISAEDVLITLVVVQELGFIYRIYNHSLNKKCKNNLTVSLKRRNINSEWQEKEPVFWKISTNWTKTWRNVLQEEICLNHMPSTHLDYLAKSVKNEEKKRENCGRILGLRKKKQTDLRN